MFVMESYFLQRTILWTRLIFFKENRQPRNQLNSPY